MALVHVALGSNLGDRRSNIAAAFRHLAALSGASFLTRSSVYETPPLGVPGQGAYYNAVCAMRTRLAPRTFLRRLQLIESVLGRHRDLEPERWGPRTLDLDILLWNGKIIDTPDLTVPHPRLAERAFVLVPLAEIAGDARHPAAGRTIRELLERLDRGEREAIRRISF